MTRRLLGIVGPSYSGSTLLGLILGGLPGVAFIGESHWIKDGDKRCQECGSTLCPVFSGAILQQLKTAPEAEWWQIIHEAAGCEILVSSDKAPENFQRFGKRPDVVLQPWKDPRAHVWSYAVQNREAFGRPLTQDEITDGIAWWLKYTGERLAWWQSQGIPGVTVNLEELSTNPPGELEKLCHRLDLEFSPAALNYWDFSHHYIGGNYSAKRRNWQDGNHYFNRAIRPDLRWKDWPTEEQAERIISDPQVVALTTKLKELGL